MNSILAKKVLITGGAGYIGSVLTRILLRKGYQVKVVDNLFFGGESVLGLLSNPNYEFVKGDIRVDKLIIDALKSCDAVVHLAAIVGDPACSQQPELAEEINWTASKKLYDYSVESTNIKRFIFASTCSNYGKMDGDGFVDENSPLKPVSLYAELKVKFENYLLNSKTREDFVPTALRFATVYGISPRMRFDLTVNEFVRDLTLGKELQIFGEQFWRPYCHVYDLANSCALVLESDSEKVNHQVFNVGSTEENYQKKMLADMILKVIPNAQISYVKRTEDPRDYRVNFDKISNVLGFEISRRVIDGITEIHQILEDNYLYDPYSNNYQNI